MINKEYISIWPDCSWKLSYFIDSKMQCFPSHFNISEVGCTIIDGI